MTLRELLDAWLVDVQDRVDLSDGTKRNYQGVVRLLVEWAGSEYVSSLRVGDYVRRRRLGGIAERTIALELRVLTIAANWGHSSGLIPSDVTLSIPKLKVDPKKFAINHYTPTPGEAGRVIAMMDRDDWRIAALLLARTGARVGEIVSLRSRDLDEVRGTLLLGASRDESKTGVRLFPLDPHSLRDLRGRGGHGTVPLLHFDGLADAKQGIRRRLMDACLQAEVSPFTPHGLRRMVVGRLIRARVDPGTAAALTGHSIKVMLQHYQQVTDEDRREATVRANLAELIDE